jgi:hypothetical protein
MKDYIKKFRQGSGCIGMNAIDYYKEKGKIIKHSWAMGGSSKEEVDSVPLEIDGYRVIHD